MLLVNRQARSLVIEDYCAVVEEVDIACDFCEWVRPQCSERS
jgi:hypothetical protein